MKKATLLGVEIKTHNNRESSLVSITRQMCFNILQWVDENHHDEVMDTISMEQRTRIAERNVEDVNGLFRAMYFMNLTKEPNYFNLDDIIAWNGAD